MSSSADGLQLAYEMTMYTNVICHEITVLGERSLEACEAIGSVHLQLTERNAYTKKHKRTGYRRPKLLLGIHSR